MPDQVGCCQYSGTTCTIVLMRGPQLIAAHVGDSRCMVVEKNGTCKQLTREHKPIYEGEYDRITRHGGKVHPFMDPDTGLPKGVERVWLTTKD